MLRHYDSTGLLQPQHVDEKTGYRYYSEDQFQTAMEIIRLKRYGFSLDEIKKLFAKNDPDFFRQQLRIKIDATARNLIETTAVIHEMERLLSGDTPDLNTKKTQQYSILSGLQPEQYIIRKRSVISERDMDRIFTELYEVAEKSGLYPVNIAGAVFYGEDYDCNAADIELFIPIRNNKLKKKLTVSGIELAVIPEHHVIATIHHGDYETIGAAWHAVETAVIVSDIEICGEPYEIYLRGSESGGSEADYITQVCFRTSKKLR